MTFEGLGLEILELVAPVLEGLAPIMPGNTFPRFFDMEMMQRSLIASLMVTIVAGILGVFLIIQNLSLIGDGLAHVSFGGVAVAIVLGATNPLWYALLFSVIAAILIHELQARDILTGRCFHCHIPDWGAICWTNFPDSLGRRCNSRYP